MEDWFKLYPNRLFEEVEELRANGILVEDPIIDEEIVQKYGIILFCTVPEKNDFGFELGKELKLKIIFPNNFPYFRPQVFVVDGIKLPRHNGPDGNLCLIPRLSQFWNVSDSIFKYLKERLPIVFQKGTIIDQDVIGEDPNEQAEPISEYYAHNTNAIFLSPRPKFNLDEVTEESGSISILDHGRIELSVNNNHDTIKLINSISKEGRYSLFSLIDVNSENCQFILKDWFDSEDNKIAEFSPKRLLKENRKYHASWYQINDLKLLINESNNFDLRKFFELIKDNGLKEPKRCSIKTKDYQIKHIICLRFPEELQAGKIDWGWSIIVHGQVIKVNGTRIQENLEMVFMTSILSLDSTDLALRIPNSKILADKTISIVGLGSLGAPSVIEFAKNGVKRLKLLDFDIVDTANSVRWPLGFEYAGILKTVALKDFIEKNYPYVQVEIFNHKIGSTDFMAYPNENKVLDDFLNDTSIVYDASAEEGINNLISSICREQNIPYMEIEGRNGAWGGLVMRVLPETNHGCWMCLQYSLYEDGIVPKPKQENNGGIQPRGCGDLTYTGSSFDLQNISLAGVRMAISTLSNNKSGGNWDVAILSMVDENDNPIAPNWSTHELKINPKCPFCNADRLDQ